MDSYLNFESIIKSEGKALNNWNKLLIELKESKEK